MKLTKKQLKEMVIKEVTGYSYDELLARECIAEVATALDDSGVRAGEVITGKQLVKFFGRTKKVIKRATKEAYERGLRDSREAEMREKEAQEREQEDFDRMMLKGDR